MAARAQAGKVPTMAIETCYMYNNTSIIPDESLAHRLGLVPINADPRKFQFRGDSPSDDNFLVFNLHVMCKSVPGVSRDAPEDEKFVDSKGLCYYFPWYNF